MSDMDVSYFDILLTIQRMESHVSQDMDSLSWHDSCQAQVLKQVCSVFSKQTFYISTLRYCIFCNYYTVHVLKSHTSFKELLNSHLFNEPIQLYEVK